MDHSRVLLNLGCGNTFHPDWVNLDLFPQSPGIRQADLSKGIPFRDHTADAVYHSHVLEHLPRVSAKNFIEDCFRVLKPGGILRIAVPDLEQIARQYLLTTASAWEDPSAEHLANHRWMQLELLDQILRKQSGGEMGQWMSDPNLPNREFVLSRLGKEVHHAQKAQRRETPKKGFWSKFFMRLKNRILRLLLGKKVLEHLEVARFRESGEIHQWMYDRVSLRAMLSAAGFTNFQICHSQQSQIDSFNDYQLDCVQGLPIKPDSIFVEATKPADLQNATVPQQRVA